MTDQNSWPEVLRAGDGNESHVQQERQAFFGRMCSIW